MPRPPKPHKKPTGAGRPPIVIDFEQLEGLCRIMATQEEICHWFSCDRLTLDRRIKEKTEFTNFEQYYKKHSADGRISLRRKQLQKAIQDGDTTMLIWLGKNQLGQRDKAELTGPEDENGKPQPVEIRFVAPATKTD